MLIKLSPFGGMIPRMGGRLLPDTAARVASSFKLQSGELRPMRQPGLLYSPSSPKNGLQLSIFKARNGASSEAWFSWPIDVDCVRVPLAADVESRFCWTGDGPPKMATYTNAVLGAGNNYPLLASELTLGIPTPQTAPTVTPSATGSGSNVTRFYRYTFVSQNGEESSPSPVSAIATGKLDDTWAIAAIDTVPVNTTTGTAAFGTVTTFTTTAAAKHWLRVGDEIYFTVGAGIDPTLKLTVATVPSASTFTVAGNYATATTWIRKTNWNTTSMVKRLYRTTGSTGSWQLVNDTGIAAATTTYNDTLTDALIAGDEMISEGWEPPRVGMHSLCVHPSGSLMGIYKNLLCMSEPYQPHAWPSAYELASGYNGVGLALFGSSVVMATAGMPFVATGVEPASMTGEDVQGMYPCLSKRSVISIGNAVLYASLHGLISVGAQGVSVFTASWFTKDEWPDYSPDTMICATAYGRVYALYTSNAGLQTLLVFDGPLLTSVDGTSIAGSELYADVSSGELYITKDTGILLWDDPLEAPLDGSWASKDFVLPAPANMGAGKIEFDTAIDPSIRTAILALIASITASNALLVPTPGDPLTATDSDMLMGAFADDDYTGMEISGSALIDPPNTPASNTVTLSLFSGDKLLASKVVSDTKVFRLPAGYKKDVFSVQVTSQCTVKGIRLAETPSGLRDG
jgi:hypothetical protein